MANKDGNPNFGEIRNRDTSAANAKRKAKADAYAKDVGRILNQLETRGLRSHGLAKLLNAEGYRTIMGKEWTATSVKRVFERLRRISRP